MRRRIEKVLEKVRPGRRRKGIVAPKAVHAVFTENSQGRDFVAGDVYGEFGALESALAGVGFDEASDRLFCVGNLVDRGARSEEAIEWLEEEHLSGATRGNHEDVMIEVLTQRTGLRRVSRYSKGFWHGIGGDWWDRRERSFEESLRWLEHLLAMPLAITVRTAWGDVGIVHGLPCRGAWANTVRRLESGEDRDAEELALWGHTQGKDAELGGERPDVRDRVITEDHEPARRMRRGTAQSRPRQIAIP